MKKSLKRAVAVSAVCAAGLAGTLTTTTTATADEARKAPAKELTDFGMTALAYGTKVGVGGVGSVTAEMLKAGDIKPEHWRTEVFGPSAGQTASAIALILVGFACSVGIGLLGGEEEDPEGDGTMASDATQRG